MKHEVIDFGNGQVYVVNIPEHPLEGELDIKDRVILYLNGQLNSKLLELGYSGQTETLEFESIKLLKEHKEDKGE